MYNEHTAANKAKFSDSYAKQQGFQNRNLLFKQGERNVDPVDFLNDIINENMDRLIVARLQQDLEMVAGQDAVLEAALRRVIRFLQPDAVLPEAYTSHNTGEPCEF